MKPLGGPRVTPERERAALIASVRSHLAADDLDAARDALHAVLLTDPEWQPVEAGLISSYVTARNAGVPVHRAPMPVAQGGPQASVETVIEGSITRTEPFEIIGGQPPFLGRLGTGASLRRPDIKLWRIPDATVLYNKGAFLVRDANGVTVPDASGHGSAPLGDIFEEATSAKPVKVVDGRALLLVDTTDGANFCHWMSDQLTRLAVYEIAGVTPGALLVDAVPGGFHRETLEATRDLHTSVIEMRNVPTVHARELFVASSVGVDFRHPAHKAAPWAIDFLTGRLLDATVQQGSEDVYISRSDAERRRVVNEAELERMLVGHGYQVISLSGMDVVRQAELFFTARSIVSPHGAGLTNLAFSTAGTRVLELFPNSYGTPSFAIIAGAIGLDYAAMVCEAVPIEEGRPNTDDMRVDVDLVERWLDG